MTADLDMSSLPRGDRGWRAFIEKLASAVGTIESYCIEIKGELALDKPESAKIAKFILGAANRPIDLATRYLEGYAVMVIGIDKKGTIPGIPPKENLDLEKRLRPYLGIKGPHWDTQRVDVGTNRQVLIIIVDPPKMGDPLFVCRKDGADVEDGGIYIRDNGATRRVKSEEYEALREREHGRPDVEIEVSTASPICTYRFDPSILDEYTNKVRKDLLCRLPSEQSPLQRSMSLAYQSVQLPSSLIIPEDRTEDLYRAEIEEWTTHCRACMPALLNGLISHNIPATSFVIQNRTERDLSSIRLDLHLEGRVEQIKIDNREDFDILDILPAIPRPWGPRPRDFGFDHSIVPYLTPKYIQSYMPAVGPSITLKSSATETDCRLELPELRPLGAEELADESVLVVCDETLTAVRGSWAATARGVDAVFKGECTIPVERVDLSEILRAALQELEKRPTE